MVCIRAAWRDKAGVFLLLWNRRTNLVWRSSRNTQRRRRRVCGALFWTSWIVLMGSSWTWRPASLPRWPVGARSSWMDQIFTSISPGSRIRWEPLFVSSFHFCHHLHHRVNVMNLPNACKALSCFSFEFSVHWLLYKLSEFDKGKAHLGKVASFWFQST